MFIRIHLTRFVKSNIIFFLCKVLNTMGAYNNHKLIYKFPHVVLHKGKAKQLRVSIYLHTQDLPFHNSAPKVMTIRSHDSHMHLHGFCGCLRQSTCTVVITFPAMHSSVHEKSDGERLFRIIFISYAQLLYCVHMLNWTTKR